MPTIFSRIISGEIPSHKVYEDDQIYAFLDNSPMQTGHTLIVPKVEIGDMLQLPDELYTHIMLVAKNILGPAIRQATGCARIGYSVEWFGVPDHAHLHLIPLFKGGDLHPSNIHKETPEEMAAMAGKILEQIK